VTRAADSATIRTQLGLSRSAWARLLNVHVRTVVRWEDLDVDPGGLANEVMQGIANALEDGADAKRVSRLVARGIGVLLSQSLLRARL
jgi:DNA-binding transcriptional regulator YiaG